MATDATIIVDRYVVDVLMRDLVGHDRCPSAFVVYVAIHAAAADGRALFSYQAMADLTGLSKRTCQNAVALLQRRGLVEVSRKGATDAAEYLPLRPWDRGGA
ncbi:MAG TPA: helix-turn-helix domain-containing protein [Sphingomicrobium sp.]|nr:helix-turn-helix domain-containing protein [Sphingomicrobium sp.]